MRFSSIFSRYSFLWVTLILFIGSVVGHWWFGWLVFVEDQTAHGEGIEAGAYAVEMLRDAFENWQSEFLQLMWQVAGLAFLFHIGSPQSKEGDDRKEEKIDAIIELLDPKNAQRTIKRLDHKYPRV